MHTYTHANTHALTHTHTHTLFYDFAIDRKVLDVVGVVDGWITAELSRSRPTERYQLCELLGKGSGSQVNPNPQVSYGETGLFDIFNLMHSTAYGISLVGYASMVPWEYEIS